MSVKVGSFLAVLVVTGVSAIAQTPPVYPTGDPRGQIAAAVAAAKHDGRHVLLDFGADWCPDCRVLDVVLKDPQVQPFVEANFHVVRIDVGRRDKNGDLAELYKATSGEWIPALVALDGAGTVLGGTSTDVRFTRRTTAPELIALLQRWAPKRLVAELTSFQQSGVRVTMGIEEDSLRQVWLAATFRPLQADVHLYGASLPEHGRDGLGRPTHVSLVSSSALKTTGPAISDRPEEGLSFDWLKTVLPVYPAGPVTLRVPVTIAASPASRRATVRVTYMGCSDIGCLPPVDRTVEVTLLEQVVERLASARYRR